MHGFVSESDAIGQLSRYSEFFELRYPDGRVMPLDDWPISRAKRGEYVRDYEVILIRRGHPEPRSIVCNAVAIHDRRGCVTRNVFTLVDITERKRTEEELERSRSLLKASLESTADGILVVDARGRISQCNRKFAEMWRLPPEIMVSQEDDRALAFVLAQLEAPEEFLRKVKDLYARPEAESFDTLRFKDGRTFERYSQPQRLGKEIVGRVWSFRDITERKQTEARIREQAALLETATDAIMVRDLDHRIVYWNKGAERLYGWAAPDVVGRLAPELLHVDRDAFEEAYRTVRQKGEWSGEFNQLSRERHEITVLARWMLVRDERDRPKSVFVINTDITERKKLEAQLYRAQRLESIGELASGIAHDLNNILAPLTMVTPLLRAEIKNPDVLRLVDIMEANTRRGANVVKQILAFSRGLKGIKGPVPLRPLLKELGAMMAGNLPEIRRDRCERPGGTLDGRGRHDPAASGVDEPVRQRPRRHAGRGPVDGRGGEHGSR